MDIYIYIYTFLSIYHIARPASDDNVLVFTDGNPNEGIVDAHTLIDEFHSRTYELKHTHNYPDGYEIRLTVIGTEGFLPSVLFDLGQVGVRTIV